MYRHLILDQGNNKELVDRFRRYFSWRLAKKTLKSSGDAWRHFSWGESMGEPGFEPMQVAVNHKKKSGGFVDAKKSLYSFWQELKASGCGLFSMIAIDARNGKVGLDSMSVADWYRICALRAYQPEITVVDKKTGKEEIKLLKSHKEEQIVEIRKIHLTGLVNIFGIELDKSWLLACTKQTTNANGVTTETFNPAGQQCREIASKLKAAQEKNKGMILEARHGKIAGGHYMPVFKDGDNWVLRDHGGDRTRGRVRKINSAADVWETVRYHVREVDNKAVIIN